MNGQAAQQDIPSAADPGGGHRGSAARGRARGRGGGRRDGGRAVPRLPRLLRGGRPRPGRPAGLPGGADREGRVPRPARRRPGGSARSASRRSTARFSSLSLRPAWVLNDLYVAPSGRRTGAGRALLREVLRRAREAGVSGVQLETAYDNTVAQGLYEAEGFVREEFHVYFHDLG